MKIKQGGGSSVVTIVKNKNHLTQCGGLSGDEKEREQLQKNKNTNKATTTILYVYKKNKHLQLY